LSAGAGTAGANAQTKAVAAVSRRSAAAAKVEAKAELRAAKVAAKASKAAAKAEAKAAAAMARERIKEMAAIAKARARDEAKKQPTGKRKRAAAEIFIVEKLLDRRQQGSKVQYLVRWEGYSASDDTWEDERNILDDSLIDEFTTQFVAPTTT
jgi:hypothetical protein